MASKKIENVSSLIGQIQNVGKAKDLSDFGKVFQTKFLALLIKDRIFSFSIIPIINFEYFTDVHYKKIFLIIKNYTEKYSSTPSVDNISIMLKENGENIKLYEKLLEEINEVSLEDRDFIITKARQFCFSKYALLEQEKVTKLLMDGKFEEAKATSIDSFKYDGNQGARIYNLKEDFIKIFDDTVVHKPIPTIYPTFNENMQGGPGSGNLVIMVAPSNFGKTMALVAMARHANLQGKTVFFFSFEIGGLDIIRRHLAGIFKIEQHDLKNNRSLIEMKMGDKTLGNFILIEEKATTARVNTMKTHIEQFKAQGMFPDMICVDSLNQLKLPVGMRYEGDNQKFEYLAEELRDLAKDEDCPLWTVYQTNRSGFEETLNDEKNIGKAIEPLQVADVLITYSQPKAMVPSNKCYAFLVKNRLGKKYIVLECHYDPSMCLFEELAVVDELMLMTDEQRKMAGKNAQTMAARVRDGEFDKKK